MRDRAVGFAVGALIGAVSAVAGLVTLDSCSPAPPAAVVPTTVVEAKHAGDYLDSLCECRREGREAGSYSVYLACEQAHDL